MADPIHFEYHIDAAGVIRYTSDTWDPFALANEGDAITSARVIGTSLWDHIENADTRHIYQALAERVRTSGKAVLLDFRCDSPGLKREMTLSLRPLDNGHIAFHSVLLHTSEHERMLNLLRKREPSRLSGELMRMCSFCKAVDVGEDDWRPIEEAVQILNINLHDDIVPQISHGACPVCFKRMMSEIEQLER